MSEGSNMRVTDLQRLVHPADLYSCTTCGLPIGSSSDGASIAVSGNVIFLKDVTRFVKRGRVTKSNDDHDAGSKYQTLSCTKCHNVLGRFYRSTPQKLKHTLDLFCIDKTSIKEYHFGEQLQQYIPESEAPITVEMNQVYLEQITQQKILLRMLLERLPSENSESSFSQ